MALSFREKAALTVELSQVRKILKQKGAPITEKVKAMKRLPEIRAVLGVNVKQAPAEPEVNPDLEAMRSGGWNKLEPKPFIEKVEALVDSGVAVLSDAIASVESYLTARGAI